MSDSNRSSGSDEKPTVRARRRRPTRPQSPGGRSRAQAPKRVGPSDSGTTRPSLRTTAGSSQRQQSSRVSTPRPVRVRIRRTTSGRATGRSRRTLIILSLLALGFVCVVGYILMQSDGLGSLGVDSYVEQPATEVDAPVVVGTEVSPTRAPLATAEPLAAPAVAGDGETWTVMLYQDADDKVLEKDIYVDLNEAERVGSSESVQIVSQIDRYRGGYSEDGDWTSAKRYYVTRDQDLNRVGSQLLADLGEVNMADGDTLVDFCVWAIEAYPADRYALIMSDHGMGWPGGWSDPSHATRGEAGTPLSSALGNQLYLDEMDGALATIRRETGIGGFELIGMDACLMGQVEVYTMLSRHARYAVASEETEPGLGWAYSSFLGALVQDPTMDGAGLGEQIVDSYVVGDQRIVDDEARADLLRQGSPMGGLMGVSAPSAPQVASQMGRNTTLSAIDLSRMPALVEELNNLCAVLQTADQRPAAKARNYAQSYTNIFGKQVPPAYIDLGHWLKLLQQADGSSGVNSAADGVLSALRAAVVAEKHGPSLPGSTGMAIYFPNSQLFRAPAAGPQSYTVIASTFAGASLWDDYLVFHYTGRGFDADAREPVVPAESDTVSAPGQGDLSLGEVFASSKVAAPGSPILLTTAVSGDNLGHVLLFAGYYDAAANSLLMVDNDYLESDDTREIDGVYFPVWPDEPFTLEFEWEPIVFYISDGVDWAPALLTPAVYGATGEDAVYTVDGIYTFQTGEQRAARLYFRDGQLRRVFGFSSGTSSGAPREIYPQTGDRFTIIETWLDLDSRGQVVNRANQEAGTLTFRDGMFTWEVLDAAAGDYLVGFIAEDLDGNRQQAFAQVVVE